MLLNSLRDGLDGRLPMHMPGHKRNALLAPYLAQLGAVLDITEIDGFDNLHAPEGLLKEAMQRAAAVYGAAHTHYLINGSTAGILAGVRALVRHGGGILMQRTSHLSVYYAAALSRAPVRYLYEQSDPLTGAPVPPEADQLEQALRAFPECALVVLTSPTYEGRLADLPALVAAAHAHGAAVLVDAAHGAHLGLHPAFEEGAITSGADIVVHSLHKTLPALTQCALAHARDDDISRRLAEQLDIFQTSSPSYLLMASIDGCMDLLTQNGAGLFDAWVQRIRYVEEELSALTHLQLMRWQHMDDSKLLVSCHRANITGHELAKKLSEEHAVDVEMAADRSLLAMTGLGDTQEGMQRFVQALQDIDKDLAREDKPPMVALGPAEEVLPAAIALEAPYERVSLQEAQGRVCAEYVCAYPPGAPVLVPGERVSSAAVAHIQQAGALLKTRSKGHPDSLCVLIPGVSNL